MKLLILIALMIPFSAYAEESRMEKQARELQQAGFDAKVVSKKDTVKSLSPRLNQLAEELQSAGFEVKSK